MHALRSREKMLVVEWQRRGRCTERKTTAGIVLTVDTLTFTGNERDKQKYTGNLESKIVLM